MIAIINYGSGNIAALANIFKHHRVPFKIVDDPRELASADQYLLPGVGAFDPTMERLSKSKILDALSEEVMGNGKCVLGICVGMHLLAEGSEEGEAPGIGWIKGRVRRIDTSRIQRPPFLPHMGWNSISKASNSHLFDEIDVDRGFYFLHSYFFDAEDPANVLATVSYGSELPCAVGSGPVYGVQFHPEKSHSNGVRLLLNFAERK